MVGGAAPAERVDSGQGMGVVVIGRNEGERLRRCLESLGPWVERCVYVDSGSEDGSVQLARERGALAVELDLDEPFTAARARNAGFEALLVRWPELVAVQFVDGDCELDPDWLESAARSLDHRPTTAAICGRRLERAPHESPYNRLADLEWDGPLGSVEWCGGDALFRVRALRAAGGYDAALIAGEEPELCLRLRRGGWAILRLDRDMTLHDAGLHRFRQWWQRQVRAGHAYAEVAFLHAANPERFWVRQTLSAVAWGGLPIATAALIWPTRGAALALLALYAVLWGRVYRSRRYGVGDAPRPALPAHARLEAHFAIPGKLAQLQGVLRFAWNRLVRGRATKLIEYKRARQARPSRVLAVASGGGHWVQMQRVLHAFSGHDLVLVGITGTCEAPPRGSGDGARARRVYAVNDATRWDRLGLFVLALRIARILWRERPHVVFSTGAAPGCLAIALGRLCGARTIWLDSMANVDRLSLSGRLVKPFAHLRLTQWEHLARPGGPEFSGRVF